MPIYKVHHDKDPSERIFAKAGDLSEYEVFNSQVLVGVYIRPEKTASGLIMTTKTRDEDKFQGKVGVILKMGPRAFKDDNGVWFKDEDGRDITFDIGDWVVFRASDGWAITLPLNGPSDDTDADGGKGFLCRLMDDVAIRMRIPHPDAVY